MVLIKQEDLEDPVVEVRVIYVQLEDVVLHVKEMMVVMVYIHKVVEPVEVMLLQVQMHLPLILPELVEQVILYHLLWRLQQ